MGRVLTPRYRVAVTVAGPHRFTPFAWQPEYGRPNAGNLAAFVRKLEASCEPGGANEHLGPVKVLVAQLSFNRPGGDVLETYRQA
jgi:hypothetical protein